MRNRAPAGPGAPKRNIGQVAKLRGDLHLVCVTSRSGVAHSIEGGLLSLGDASLRRGRNSPEPTQVLKLAMISTPSIRVSPLRRSLATSRTVLLYVLRQGGNQIHPLGQSAQPHRS